VCWGARGEKTKDGFLGGGGGPKLGGLLGGGGGGESLFHGIIADHLKVFQRHLKGLLEAF